jgi:hypothetical protein
MRRICIFNYLDFHASDTLVANEYWLDRLRQQGPRRILRAPRRVETTLLWKTRGIECEEKWPKIRSSPRNGGCFPRMWWLCQGWRHRYDGTCSQLHFFDNFDYFHRKA